MAATRSPHHLLLSVSICFCYSLLLISSSAPLATALSFSFHFSTSGDLCDTELRCEHDTRMDSGVIQLTRNEIHDFFSVGRASYARPVPLWDDATREVASFSSNFTFQIRPKSDTDQIQLRNRCNGNGIGNGDGMAFFLSPYPSKLPPNSYGTNLALFNDSSRISATGDDRVVAVEFDTVLGGFDVSNSHVGIDINSIDSKAYTNVTRSMVSDEAIMAAEISYDARTGVLTARLQMEGEEPYNVKWPVDMATTLPQDVAVGFSAATGSCIELHQVLSWSFSSTLDRAGTSLRRRRLVAVLVSSAVVAFVVLLCAAAVILVRRRRMWQRLDDSDDEEREQAEFERGVGPRRYRYRELATATKDFVDEEKLGRGGFGNVYRGSLSDQDHPVAIKMLSTESSAQGRREFESEVKIISRLRHRNLVQLLGWSDSRRGLLLVYELVSEGSLDRHIYSTTLQLTWPQRYKIILGLGSALRYLHTEWDQCVLHGDIKPSNILLDSSRGTKLADFGLARLVEHGAGPRTTQVVMGTLGYIDPEFIRTRRPSAESDVYSFGIVLLEIVSGQRPEMEAEQPADKAIPLLKWIWELHEKGAVVEAVDGRLEGDEQLADGHGCRWQPRRALLVGLWCTHPRPSARPSVEQAMSALQSEDVALPALSRPPPDVSPGSHGYSASSTNVFSDVSWASSGR